MNELQNRYLLRVTHCRKLKPEGVEVVIEIRPKPQAGQEAPAAYAAATTNDETSPEVSHE